MKYHEKVDEPTVVIRNYTIFRPENIFNIEQKGEEQKMKVDVSPEYRITEMEVAK